MSRKADPIASDAMQPLETLPVFYPLEGKRVLVIGGGEGAARGCGGAEGPDQVSGKTASRRNEKAPGAAGRDRPDRRRSDPLQDGGTSAGSVGDAAPRFGRIGGPAQQHPQEQEQVPIVPLE